MVMIENEDLTQKRTGDIPAGIYEPTVAYPKLGAGTAGARASMRIHVNLGHFAPWWLEVIAAIVVGAFIWALVRKMNSDD
jgi:hypothetical protein